MNNDLRKYSYKNLFTGKLVELYEPKLEAPEVLIEINKQKYKKLKLELLKYQLKETLKNLNEVNELYKELYNRTELWEKKETWNFCKEWQTIRKTNGKITRYYNEILKILKEKE